MQAERTNIDNLAEGLSVQLVVFLERLEDREWPYLRRNID
jgi:hypothetical protein